MNGQYRHGGGESAILEWQIFSRRLYDLRCRRTALADHCKGRFYGRDLPIDWLVRTGACTDVQNGLRLPESRLDRGCDTRVGFAKLRVVDPDAVVLGGHPVGSVDGASVCQFLSRHSIVQLSTGPENRS